MQIIVGFFIFCIVLFMYLHITFHLKTGNELELYEIDYVTKERFEEICDLRQPVIFDFENQKIMDSVKREKMLSQYGSFEVKVRESTYKLTDENNIQFLQLPLQKTSQLFLSDKESTYYTESNSDFLEETTFVKNLSYNDSFLRPYMVSNCNYDIIFGSDKCLTPFRYEVNYRTFFMLTEGSAKIKMAPPINSKYLHTDYDYEIFEFRSPMNVWKPQSNMEADFQKIKFLEFSLTPGKTLFLPAYWWYSFELSKDAMIACFRYRTYMNTLAISPYIAMYALQNQNIKREFTKKVDIKDLTPQSE